MPEEEGPKKEDRSRARFSRLCIRRASYARARKVLLTEEIRYSNAACTPAPLLFTMPSQQPRKGTWGFAIYLHEDTQVCARAHTRSRSRPSNPLIGFIRASSIAFSQEYTNTRTHAYALRQRPVFTAVISCPRPRNNGLREAIKRSRI